jgi:hypothetical protein
VNEVLTLFAPVFSQIWLNCLANDWPLHHQHHTAKKKNPKREKDADRQTDILQ